MRSKRQVNWKGKNRIPSKAATPTYSKNDCFKVPKNELSTEPKNVASNYRTGVSTEIAARAKTLRIMIFFANLGKVIFTTRTQSTRRIDMNFFVSFVPQFLGCFKYVKNFLVYPPKTPV